MARSPLCGFDRQFRAVNVRLACIGTGSGMWRLA